ncbi:hypothetical protein GM921_15555 [Pedobacter sp. LMG 31464]|uniref:Uncharacterized protein n=1 Tax=Pedobacter planticolens TaxID=2679964 RepID=A0A923E1E6_9SPHI|nr:hypothetical protein [Pedobacter planticolens]MBB2146920.1 hypothetical protein [Pedobacter planticolens]
MKKFPFTNADFLALQHDLYNLNDEVLKIEADLVLNDFDYWMNNHFELSVNQLCFLKCIDARAKPLITFNTSFAIENRLLIILNKARNSNSDEQGKIIWHKSTLTASSGGNTGYRASGTLEINIAYQPIEILKPALLISNNYY